LLVMGSVQVLLAFLFSSGRPQSGRKLVR
jgi:hypothetical protein